MTLHRFSFSLAGDPISDESSVTIDGAIFTAGRLWAAHRSPIYVREVQGATVRMRGVVDANGWHWLVTCPKCNGAGDLTKHVAGTHSPIKTCTRCSGDKLVRKDEA